MKDLLNILAFLKEETGSNIESCLAQIEEISNADQDIKFFSQEGEEDLMMLLEETGSNSESCFAQIAVISNADQDIKFFSQEGEEDLMMLLEETGSNSESCLTQIAVISNADQDIKGKGVLIFCEIIVLIHLLVRTIFFRQEGKEDLSMLLLNRLKKNNNDYLRAKADQDLSECSEVDTDHKKFFRQERKEDLMMLLLNCSQNNNIDYLKAKTDLDLSEYSEVETDLKKLLDKAVPESHEVCWTYNQYVGLIWDYIEDLKTKAKVAGYKIVTKQTKQKKAVEICHSSQIINDQIIAINSNNDINDEEVTGETGELDEYKPQERIQQQRVCVSKNISGDAYMISKESKRRWSRQEKKSNTCGLQNNPLVFINTISTPPEFMLLHPNTEADVSIVNTRINMDRPMINSIKDTANIDVTPDVNQEMSINRDLDKNNKCGIYVENSGSREKNNHTEHSTDLVSAKRIKQRNSKTMCSSKHYPKSMSLSPKATLTLEELAAALDGLHKLSTVTFVQNSDPLLPEPRILRVKGGNLRGFLERLHSFLLGKNNQNKIWKNDKFVWAGPLAAAGFSYDGEDDIVVCKYCNCRSDTTRWTDNDENYALSMHKAGCDFLKVFGGAQSSSDD